MSLDSASMLHKAMGYLYRRRTLGETATPIVLCVQIPHCFDSHYAGTTTTYLIYTCSAGNVLLIGLLH